MTCARRTSQRVGRTRGSNCELPTELCVSDGIGRAPSACPLTISP